MKLAFNNLAFEVTNTGSLRYLAADIQLARSNEMAFETLTPALYAEPNAQNKFVFYAHKNLVGRSKLTPSVPNLLNKNMLFVPNALAKIKLAYHTSPVVYSAVIDILSGGSSDENLLDNFITKKKFLTHQPTSKLIDDKFLDFLYWLHIPANYTSPITIIAAEYEVTFEDGAKETFVQQGIDVASENVVIQIPVGYWAVASRDVQDNLITSFSIRLVDQTRQVVLSEKRTYHILAKQDMPAVYLCFRNSFNLWDSIRFNGTFSESFDADSQKGSTSSNAVVESESEGFTTLKINTGRMLKGWISYLKEIMLSNEIYLMKGSALVPLAKVSKSINQIDYAKRDDVSTLEFRIAKTETYS